MTAVLVVGEGRLGRALMAAGGEGVKLVWAPAQAVADGGEAERLRPAWAVEAGVPAAADWRRALEEAEAVAVDLAGEPDWRRREEVAEAALARGRAVWVDAPASDRPEGYARLLEARAKGGGRLWSVRPVRRSLAAQAGERALAAGAAGRVLALYGALRLPTGGAGASLEQSWADLMDAALSLAGPQAALVRLGAWEVRDEGGFEAVQAVGRLTGGEVATLEVAHCLTAGSGEEREALFEVTGEEGIVRVRPDGAHVEVTGARPRRVPWREDPIAAAWQAFLAGADEGEAEAEADRRVIAALGMLRRARARGDAHPAAG
jgi:predicted dehydrogenase